jgi:hypothetical protein
MTQAGLGARGLLLRPSAGAEISALLAAGYMTLSVVIGSAVLSKRDVIS